jgi:periplasmic protein CpxP/Spy
MKKQFFLALVTFIIAATSVNAQGGFQRRTPEERLKQVHEKIVEVIKLDADKLTKIDAIFLESFKQQDAKMEEIRNSGSFDREAMQAAREQLTKDRDAKLKEVLNEEEMKKYKDEVEPALRPQRGNRNG